MRRRGILSSSLALGLAAKAWAGEVLRVGSSSDLSTAVPGQAVIRAAYARLGLAVQIEEMPLGRATGLLAEGRLDALLIRAQAFFDHQPAAVKVDVPIVETRFVVFRRGACPERVSPADLAGRRVAYERGVLALEQVLPEGSRYPVNNGRDLLRLLRAGRADDAVALATPAIRDVVLRSAPELCAVAEPLLKLPLFHALQARHADLKPGLEKVLAEMQRSGEIRRIFAAHDEQLRGLTLEQLGW